MKNTFSDPIITRESPIILLIKFIFLTLFFNILFVLTSIGYAYLRQYFGRPNIAEPTVFIALLIIEIMIFIVLIIIWFSKYVIVDDHFIVHRNGVLFTKESRYKLDTINNLSIIQSPISKILRYGDIRISHSNNEIMSLHAIPYPNQFVYLIEQKIDIMHRINES